MENEERMSQNKYVATAAVETSGSHMNLPVSQQESLQAENLRLRDELARFKMKVGYLQSQIRQQNSSRPSNNHEFKTINIEMASAQSDSHNKQRTSPLVIKEMNDAHSFDYEQHESFPGLHRRPLQSNTGDYTAFNSPDRQINEPVTEEEDGIQREFVSFEEENFFKSVADRSSWLVGLLVLQSMSSFIIARNEDLLQSHGVLVQFLTMLVGAGGNAGNQASVRVIRGLAVGTIDHTNTRAFLRRELAMGFCLSVILGLSGFVRALLFFVPWPETFAITCSLLIIVASSVVIGALLPLAMRNIGIDPAHSSTTIQVVMDILGVLITVHISGWILDSLFADAYEN